MSVSFGGVTAVDELNLTVDNGEVMGMIGPNGAGKSTAINAISGLGPMAAGSISVGGALLRRRSPGRLFQMGLRRTFQTAQLWPGMSVAQNIEMPVLSMSRNERQARVETVAAQLNLKAELGLPAGGIAYGTRRLVEVARALVSEPLVMLLDEPGAGLSQAEKEILVQALRTAASEGVGVLLVDHDIEFVGAACSSVIALDAGRVISAGTASSVFADPAVVNSYLGSD